MKPSRKFWKDLTYPASCMRRQVYSKAVTMENVMDLYRQNEEDGR